MTPQREYSGFGWGVLFGVLLVIAAYAYDRRLRGDLARLLQGHEAGNTRALNGKQAND